jgi:LacI family transcriptional regulator
VAEESREKIQRIVDELNYQPNILARSLASKKNYVFVTLLPEFEKNAGEYWEAPFKGIEKAWKEIADYNIAIKNLAFNQFQVSSFMDKVKDLLDIQPDAVVLAPIFIDETIQLCLKLDEKRIPYIFIDSNIEEVNNLAYFGQHSYQSGYLAARLLEPGLAEGSSIAIFNPAGDSLSNQALNRETGFMAYFNEKGITNRYRFCTCKYDVNSDHNREQQMVKFFEHNNPIAAAVVFNSWVYEIARVVEDYAIQGVKLIGYDLLKENEAFLRKDIITFLIAQRPEEQGYQSISTLFNHLLLKREVVKNQYIPIDILTKENLEYYINFIK